MSRVPDARSGSRRAIVLRGLALLVSLIILYFFLPTLGQLFEDWPRLRDLDPIWVAAAVVFEAASFACVWWLFAIALQSSKWFAIATSQLAGNALSRVVPAGGAAGLTLQYRMLAASGVDAAAAGSALTASTLLQLATLAALPALGVVFTIGGQPIANSLRATAWIGLVAFLLLVGGSVLLAVNDRAVRLVGTFVQWLRNLVFRKRAPLTDLPTRLREQRDEVRRALGSHWWESLLATVGNRALDYFALLACLAAVGSEPNPGLVLLAYSAAAVLALIPLTPGGLGFVEAGLAATLVVAGVSGADAVLATLAYRLVSFWLPIPVGLGAYLAFRFGQRRHATA